MRSMGVRRNAVFSCFRALAFCWLSGISHASAITVFRTGGDGNIQAAQIGRPVHDLVTSLGVPIDIALDLSGGKRFWIDPAGKIIQPANRDGLGIQTAPRIDPDGVGVAANLDAGKSNWMVKNPGTDPGSGRVVVSILDHAEQLLTTHPVSEGKAVRVTMPPVHAGGNDDKRSQIHSSKTLTHESGAQTSWAHRLGDRNSLNSMGMKRRWKWRATHSRSSWRWRGPIPGSSTN